MEWWQSGDSSEQAYRDTVKAFKKKWFKGSREARMKQYIDSQISVVRSELYNMIGLDDEQIRGVLKDK